MRIPSRASGYEVFGPGIGRGGKAVSIRKAALPLQLYETLDTTLNMSRTKKSKPGGGTQGKSDGKNEKKRKREEWEEKKAQDSTTLEADESTETPRTKKTKTNNESTRNDDEAIPTPAAEQPSPEQQSTKGLATTASESAPQVFGDLANLHDIFTVSVISSSKIQKKTTAVLKHLSTYPAISPAKPALVLAHSKADTTAKLITIIEIAKRDIASSGGKWFQYNVVYQVMEQQKEKKKKDGSKHKDTAEVNDEQEEGEEDEEQLETMKTPFERAIEGQPKVRAIPHMAIYLSRIRIESLRKKYG